MKRWNAFLAAAAFAVGSTSLATAAPVTVYDLEGPGNFIDQQNGNNMYYYGDDVTLAAGAPRHLDTATLTFAYFTNSGTGTYTPNLQLDIFAIDPTTRLPTGSVLGTATVNNVTFAGSNAIPGNAQQVTFDFTSQNVTLPTDFAFLYRDNNPLGTVDPGFGFSVVGKDPSVATTGTTVDGFLDAYPNDASNHTFQFGVDGQIPGDTATGNLLATITADAGPAATPEPATLTLLGMGILGMAGYGWRRRKQAMA